MPNKTRMRESRSSSSAVPEHLGKMNVPAPSLFLLLSQEHRGSSNMSEGGITAPLVLLS